MTDRVPPAGQHRCNVFLIGPPTSGKSTQTDMVLNRPGYLLRLSPGQWLRDRKNEVDTDLGAYIRDNWNHLSLGPLLIDRLDLFMADHCNHNLGIVVDGFPRTVEQAQSMPRLCRGRPTVVVELCLDQDEIQRRANRRQRDGDDTDFALSVRFKSYWQNVDDVRAELKRLGIYRCVDASAEPSAVAERVGAVLDELERHPQLFRMSIPPQPPGSVSARAPIGEPLQMATPTESAVVYQKIARLCQVGRQRRQFCGNHPISLLREHLPRLSQYPYLISNKTDGKRYLCLVHDLRLWFMDRKLEVRKTVRIVPDLERFQGTVLDGEMVGSNNNYFVVNDCVAVAGVNCTREPILERMRLTVDLGNLLYNGPIQLRAKRYFPIHQIRQMLEFAQTEPFPTDGIVFTPKKLPYRNGIDYNLFKWKPPEHNTVDFMYDATDGRLYCRASRKGQGGEIRSFWIERGVLVQKPPGDVPSGSVVECVPAPTRTGDPQKWTVARVREDKPFPNIDWVVDNVVRSIRDNITRCEIVHECLNAGPNREGHPVRSARSTHKYRRLQ